jgi:hypothetical protein
LILPLRFTAAAKPRCPDLGELLVAPWCELSPANASWKNRTVLRILARMGTRNQPMFIPHRESGFGAGTRECSELQRPCDSTAKCEAALVSSQMALTGAPRAACIPHIYAAHGFCDAMCSLLVEQYAFCTWYRGTSLIRRGTHVLANASSCVKFWQPEVLRPTLRSCLALPPVSGRLLGAFAHAARLWRCWTEVRRVRHARVLSRFTAHHRPPKLHTLHKIHRRCR